MQIVQWLIRKLLFFQFFLRFGLQIFSAEFAEFYLQLHDRILKRDNHPRTGVFVVVVVLFFFRAGEISRS